MLALLVGHLVSGDLVVLNPDFSYLAILVRASLRWHLRVDELIAGLANKAPASTAPLSVLFNIALYFQIFNAEWQSATCGNSEGADLRAFASRTLFENA